MGDFAGAITLRQWIDLVSYLTSRTPGNVTSVTALH